MTAVAVVLGAREVSSRSNVTAFALRIHRATGDSGPPGDRYRSGECLAAEFRRGDAGGVLEDLSEVGRVAEAPAGADRGDRDAAGGRVREVAFAGFHPAVPDPPGHRVATVAEQRVEVAHRNEAGCRDGLD